MKSRIIFVLLILLMQVGCVSRTRRIPMDQRLLPAKSATREEMLRSLENMSKGIQTLQGRIDLDVSGGGPAGDVITEYAQTRGALVVERPKQIRFKVQLPIVGTTVIDMVSDGSTYQVSVPIKNKFLIGDENIPTKDKTPVLNMKPQHIVRALFVDIAPYLNDANARHFMEEVTLERRRFYVFNFINVNGSAAQLIEKVWIDRTEDLQVTRKQIFGRDGKVETDVEYSDYDSQNKIDFPKVVLVRRPIEDYTLKMTFTRTTLNETVAADAFHLERPAGAELVQPSTEETSGLKP